MSGFLLNNKNCIGAVDWGMDEIKLAIARLGTWQFFILFPLPFCIYV